mgnify:CR=1 FL=1|tara:strand:+ start:66 stop:497 length:432 start_codon:yes stop_codon:yes gene_type:complete
MASSETTDIKVDIESLKRDLISVNSIQIKLDTTIDKLTDVSSSIKSMLAVHEERIARQEKIDDIIFDKIKERAEELGKIYRELKKDIDLTEKRLLCEIKSIQNSIGARVGVLEKYRHIILGSAIVLGLILSRNFPSILTLLMN